MPIDADAKSELNRLRTEMQDLELRMMERLVASSWRWAIAIFLATLALTVTLLHAFSDKS